MAYGSRQTLVVWYIADYNVGTANKEKFTLIIVRTTLMFNSVIEMQPILFQWVLLLDFNIYICTYICRYIKDNALCGKYGRVYSDDLPNFLQNRPPAFVKHCMEKMELAEMFLLSDVKVVSANTYNVSNCAGVLF